MASEANESSETAATTGESMFEVSFEVEPVDDPDFPEECIGAFVDCFAGAKTLREALDASQQHLEAEGYRVIDIDRACRLDPEEYEPTDEDSPTLEELANALETGEVLTGPFECYAEADVENEDDGA